MSKKVAFEAYFSFWDRNRSQAKIFLYVLFFLFLFMLGFELLMLYTIGWSLFSSSPLTFMFAIFLISIYFGSIMVVMMVFSRNEMKKLANEAFLSGADLVIDYQRVRKQPRIRNRVPLWKVKKVKKHGRMYYRQRAMVTPWYDRMFMGPNHSFGALYHQYTHPGNLVVVYLRDPHFITNFDLYNILKTGGCYESAFVSEVVINIRKDDQDRFIREVKKRSSKR